MSSFRSVRVVAWAVLVVAALSPLAMDNGYYTFVATMVAITALAGSGVNVLFGLAGHASLGHAGFYAIGAYATALLATRAGLGLEVALPVGIGVGCLVALALGLACRRLSGPFLTVVTIAFGIVVEHTLIEWQSLTGGFGGIVGLGRARVGPAELGPRGYYCLVLALCSLAFVGWRNLAISPWGRALVAMRENEGAASSLGIDPVRVRLAAFVVSGAFAAGAGVLYPWAVGIASPDAFGLPTSLLFLLIVIFGGPGFTTGPLVGAIILVVLPELLHGFSEYRLIAYGVALLATIYFLPRGLVGLALPRGGAHARRRPETEGNGAAFGTWSPSTAMATPLDVRDVALRFGGLLVLDGIGLRLEPGRVHGLIGANGAGKTSLLNILSGFYVADHGTITVGQRILDAPTPHSCARAGIGRTFQTAQLFEDMTVIENVMVGLAGWNLGSLGSTLCSDKRRRVHEVDLHNEASAILEFVGYVGHGDEIAAELAFAQRRLVEIARVLARRPSVLLLDEPGAGLSERETEGLARLIRELRNAHTAILLVEHNVSFVMRVSDEVTVIDAGRQIAHGTPIQVQTDPAVLAAYLGNVDPKAGLATSTE